MKVTPITVVTSTSNSLLSRLVDRFKTFRSSLLNERCTEITFRLELNNGKYYVEAYSGNLEIGTLTLTLAKYKPLLLVTNITIDPFYKGKGVVTSMYDFVEKQTGLEVLTTYAASALNKELRIEVGSRRG